ncbi:MAG: hypothetical protein JWM10_2553 [Myxococcaceae bacterium]|nr:hypothetical protein [Myxococcaceae bacterium]
MSPDGGPAGPRGVAANAALFVDARGSIAPLLPMPMRDPRSLPRPVAAALGAEAVAILRAGRYAAPSGRVVELAAEVDRARAGARAYPPTEVIPRPPPGAHDTRFATRGESTLAATRALVDAGRRPAALNFASARNPGGGFLSGARAQEESLCRASALSACLDGAPMYEAHRARRDPMYASWTLYAPEVPVFRGDDEALLEAPWRAAFVTSPAPNVKALRENSPERLDELDAVYDDRIARVLAVAARHGHDAVVLGAWGCGAFGGSAELVAARFDAALRGGFRGVFAEVVFAVLDTSPERRTIGPFARRFGGG